MPELRELTRFRGELFFELLKSRLAGRTCYFFLNPGGLGGGVGDSLASFCKSHIYNLVLLALKAIGVRIFQVGVSYEKMGWKEVSVARLRSLACCNFSLRDGESFDYMRSLGIDASEIVPDLSFNLYQEQRNEVSPKQYAAAFSFRADRGSSSVDIRAFIRRIISAHANDARFLLLSQVARDSALMQNIQCELATEFTEQRIHFVDCHADFSDALNLYDICTVLYSNRLHALLLAAYAHAIPVAVVNPHQQRKIASLFNDLGISRNLSQLSSTPAHAVQVDRSRFVQESAKLNDFFDRLLYEKY